MPSSAAAGKASVAARRREAKILDVEGPAVPGRQAVAANGLDMLGRRVAHVAVPAVLRKLCRELAHLLVAPGFRQDRGCGDRSIGRVAMDHRQETLARVTVERIEAVPVDEQEIRRRREPQHGALHTRHRGLQDVDPVDFLRRNGLHGPGEGFRLDHRPQQVPLPLRQLLAVVQQWVVEIRRQDDRGGIDRTRQWAPSRFVAAGLQPVRLQIRLQLRMLSHHRASSFSCSMRISCR